MTLYMCLLVNCVYIMCTCHETEKYNVYWRGFVPYNVIKDLWK